MKSTITSRLTGDFLKIFINGILHLCVRASDIVMVQSWKWSDSRYTIEFVFRNGTNSLAEYDDELKWRVIIEEINSNLN